MKRLLICLLFMSLGGCATLKLSTGSSVTPNAVYVAANAYDAAVVSATNYDRLPLCTANTSLVCRTTAATKSVDAAIRAGRTYRNQLIAYVNANPGEVVPVSNYNALVGAISTIQTYVSTNGGVK